MWDYLPPIVWGRDGGDGVAGGNSRGGDGDGGDKIKFFYKLSRNHKQIQMDKFGSSQNTLPFNLVGIALTSDWSASSFIMVVYE